MSEVPARRSPASIVLKGLYEAKLNGYDVKGRFRALSDPASGTFGALVIHDDIPELGNSLLAQSSCSYVCNSCCVFSRAIDPAVNLIDVMGFPYSIDVSYHCVDEASNCIGQISQHSDLWELKPREYETHVRAEGWYRGPTDIRWSPGYAIYLHQAGPGAIEAVYGHTLIAESSRFHVLVRRLYQYQTDRTLPFDEVWHYKLLKLDTKVEDGLRKFDFRATSYYSPAEDQHGAFPEQSFSRLLEAAFSPAEADSRLLEPAGVAV